MAYEAQKNNSQSQESYLSDYYGREPAGVYCHQINHEQRVRG